LSTIEPIMSRDVHRCRPDDTLNAALQLWELMRRLVCAGDGDAESQSSGC
jgi:hypothetical protein